MALVLPLNSLSPQKPFNLANPNSKLPIISANLKHGPMLWSSIRKSLRQRRRSFIVASGLDKDSDQTPQLDGEVNNLGVKAALSMLKFYKREISPVMPNSCRYLPTCSEYSMIAYKKYGVVKGTVLTAWRLCRCNPLGGSGFDPPRWFNETSPPEQ